MDMTKAELAECIVATLKAGNKLDQDEPVSKGGRGKKSKLREAAFKAGKEHDISEATIKRAMEDKAKRAERKKATADYRRQVFEQTQRSMLDMAAEATRQQELASRIINAGYKAIAREVHPDMPGGSKEAMTRLNLVRARLHVVYGTEPRRARKDAA
jgi:hypothetical protein